jgi:fibronectin type 3 domain-containing protein
MLKSQSTLEAQRTLSRMKSIASSIFQAAGAGLSLLLLLFGMTSIAHANNPGQRSVSLSWLESDPTAVSFNIYRGTASGVCSGSPTPLASSSVKSYVDSSVTAGTTYFYAVSGVNAAGEEGSCSGEIQVSVSSAPQAPTGLQGQSH